ncbi:Crp/Fnr family transcriptional regulator [Streptomyces sp. JJ66]|uniref:Crp/Fnr family transcriptional regulator n=1 Tax=Streptomyces sp. JJ66 TaxID=2803843 RepID=UPI001C59AFCF|nr:Crp/Fnr family transcriptional regulator [Streptomyces sp. JJ66]MBW1603483.1 Crp/Fnr family transcriptional regulator [Streptomyces sp. JJ66]
MNDTGRGRYCLAGVADVAPCGPPPWAPGRREETSRVTEPADDADRMRCMSEVDIFRDLADHEMAEMERAAPMKSYGAGELLHTPQQPSEVLFILKRGRVRLFRVSADGRALTTAVISPGTIFGEMVLIGQRLYDNFAEALEDVTVCVMSRADVQRYLLSDARIAARIAEILGTRLSELEQRLSDSVFKTVPQRIATTLVTLAGQSRPARSLLSGRHPQLSLTHEQLAALAGTSRETTTKVLHDYARRGLVKLARGRITVLDQEGLAEAAGEP